MGIGRTSIFAYKNMLWKTIPKRNGWQFFFKSNISRTYKKRGRSFYGIRKSQKKKFVASNKKHSPNQLAIKSFLLTYQPIYPTLLITITFKFLCFHVIWRFFTTFIIIYFIRFYYYNWSPLSIMYTFILFTTRHGYARRIFIAF